MRVRYTRGMDTNETTPEAVDGRPRSKAAARTPDSPATAKRRAREKRTISQMICLYCRGNHDEADRTETAYCGEPLCPSCKAIDDYSVLRTERCRNMETKTSCDQCPNRCYRPEERERIRAIMRYAGPRMITAHPVAAVRHLLGK